MIKRADEGSCIIILDRNDYVKETEIQLSNQNVYKSIQFKGIISQKEFHYFTYKYKKTTSLGKMYLFPKICKKLYDGPVGDGGGGRRGQ